MMPPDVRAQIERQSSRPQRAEEKEQLEAEVAPSPEDGEQPASDLIVCGNSLCKAEIKKSWLYCPSCGRDLLSSDPKKKLKIEISEDDVHDYIFRGYIVRDLKVLGKHTITVRSAQPSDSEEIDNYIMNGEWSKGPDGEKRQVSEFYMRQLNVLCLTASSIHKVDGESIGKTMAERLEWLKARGSAFVDMVSQRVVWFNQVLTEHLKKEDTFPE